MEALAAALQTAPANGAADAAPVATNVTAAIANKTIMTLRMTSPNFALREFAIKYRISLYVNAGKCRDYANTVARTHHCGWACASARAAAAAAPSLG